MAMVMDHVCLDGHSIVSPLIKQSCIHIYVWLDVAYHLRLLFQNSLKKLFQVHRRSLNPAPGLPGLRTKSCTQRKNLVFWFFSSFKRRISS